MKLRYLDTPVFVDVGQIVAGYSMETALNAGASLPDVDATGGDTFTFGGATRFTDRPTVTYTPLTGSKFIRGLMTPLPPDAIFFLIQSGWPADNVLFSTMSSINGLKNDQVSVSGVERSDPRFMRAVQLMRRIQISGCLALRVQQVPQTQSRSSLMFLSDQASEQTVAEISELRGLLGLSQELDEFELGYGSQQKNDRELAVVTRSILHLMQMMSVLVEVSPADVAEGRATPGLASSDELAAAMQAVRIRSSPTLPDDAFVAVAYRSQWFWVDDRDLLTKRAFGFMMFLFTLADTGENQGLPLITIPAQ